MLRSRWLVPLLLALGSANACLDRPNYSYSDSEPVVGTSGFGGSISSFGGVGTAGTAPLPMCELERSVGPSAIFRSQAISNQLPARSVLYVQATDEEVESLENGGPLITPPTSDTPASPLIGQLSLLANNLSGDRQTLMRVLLRRFKVTRAAWPNPWALRLVDHAATEHMNPVLLRLKKDAWIARIIDNLPMVIRADNDAQVTLSDALAHPENIVGVFYLANDGTQGPVAMPCETGRREFALGNEAMIESLEVGTQEIADRVQKDIEALNELFDVARKCMTFDRGDGLSFHSNTVCQTWDFFDPSSEYSAYQWALGNPLELYKPTPQNLNSLVQALQADEFPPEPFVGEPHPLPIGEGGAGGAGDGGAGGGGAGGSTDGGFGGI